MYFKSSLGKIFYEKYGNSSKSIIILPGWGNTRNTFDFIINNFLNDYSIYIFDYPGFGNSPIPESDLTIYDYAYSFYEFIKEKRLYDSIVIAHSFGGRITSILAGKYNVNFSKIILIDVAGIRRISISRVIKQGIYKFLRKCFPFIRKKLLKIFSSSDYKNLPETMRSTFKNVISEDLRKYYKNISCKTLIIWGENDLDTPLKDAYLLKRIINNSELIIYKKANHFSYFYYSYKTILILESFFRE